MTNVMKIVVVLVCVCLVGVMSYILWNNVNDDDLVMQTAIDNKLIGYNMALIDVVNGLSTCEVMSIDLDRLSGGELNGTFPIVSVECIKQSQS